MSWCNQHSKDLRELRERTEKAMEEFECAYTKSSHFDAERWQLSIKLAEEAEKREQMEIKRGQADIVEEY